MSYRSTISWLLASCNSKSHFLLLSFATSRINNLVDPTVTKKLSKVLQSQRFFKVCSAIRKECFSDIVPDIGLENIEMRLVYARGGNSVDTWLA
jgi:hypothetical protein